MKTLIVSACRTFLALALVGLVTASAVAERPVAPKMLPEETLAIARISDTQLLIERFRETALGRMGQDEKIKPLVSQLYAAAQEAWKQLEDRVGLPLDQILRIPQGEVCVAFVGPRRSGGDSKRSEETDQPQQRAGVVFILDAKDQAPQVKKLLEKGEAFLRENGGTKTNEKLGDQEVAVYSGPEGTSVYQLEREGTILIASTKELMQFALDAWDGKAERTLADNDRYNSIMSRCAGSVDDPPQITWFADPIELVKTFARGNFAATGLALLPVLGLDGLKGVGGSMTFATGEFDDVTHMHVLLDTPRAGVIELLAMTSGDSEPEAWVPADVVTYNTLHWDLQQTYDKGAKLYNSLMEEGAFQNEVRVRISDRLGADFEKEILPQLQGRFTFVQWVEKPVRINSITTLAGIKIKDPAAFKPTMDRVLEKFSDNLTKETFGGTTYWKIKMPPEAIQQPQEGQLALRQPDPCVALVGDYVLISDSSAALKEAIVTSSDPTKSLANELDYKLIASKIKRQVGGDAPGFVQFTRPEEGLRFWYNLANADDTRQGLAGQARDNPFFRDIDRALKDNPLPPFSVLQQYLAPGGGMIVNDETGIHYSSFTLRRKMP